MIEWIGGALIIVKGIIIVVVRVIHLYFRGHRNGRKLVPQVQFIKIINFYSLISFTQ